MKTGKKGFTLTEILVSLTLIGFSSIFLMKCMVVSLHQLKNSGIRFQVNQTIEDRKNFLAAKGFNSPELAPGKKTLDLNGVFLEIRVSDQSPGLKKIFFRGEMGGTARLRSSLFQNN